MWPALLVFSSASGLALSLARLKVLALIPASIILSLIAVIGCIAFSMRWDTMGLAVIVATAILQSSYMIGGLLSEDHPSPRAALARACDA